jgi:hypothetical protein
MCYTTSDLVTLGVLIYFRLSRYARRLRVSGFTGVACGCCRHRRYIVRLDGRTIALAGERWGILDGGRKRPEIQQKAVEATENSTFLSLGMYMSGQSSGTDETQGEAWVIAGDVFTR